MRVKLMQPVQPTHEHMEFIRLIEQYGRVKKETLCKLVLWKDSTEELQRDLRTMCEMYFNFKFIGIKPLGKIIVRNGFYELIDREHKKADITNIRIQINAKCSYIEELNAKRVYGEVQLNGQEQMALNKLIREAQELEQELNTK